MKIFSWGSNSHGQLGLELPSEQVFEPQLISIRTHVKDIVGGGKHTLLLTGSGKLYSSGDNDQGQLLKEATVKRLLSFEPINLKIEIAKVSCGWDFNLALTSKGEVYGWGGNSYGQLGIPHERAKSVCVPEKVFAERAVDVGAGLRHSAIVGENGLVFTAGFGRKGQLGIPFDRVKNNECFTLVPSIKKGRKVSCGEHHCILSTSEDKLFAWGDNKFGQLGNDPKLQSRYEVPVKIELKFRNIKNLACGWLHNAVLTDGGEVITWGRNDYGQLGESRTENWKPKSVKLLKGTKQIALGSNHGIALKSNGDILCWGWNEHGNCGNGSCENVYEPVKLNISGLIPKLIGTGSAHSFFCTDCEMILELDDDTELEQVNDNENAVLKVDARHVTYSEFFRNFLLKNRPGILRGVTDRWDCIKLWVRNDSLNVDYFRERFGDAEVPVSNCGKKWFNVQEKCLMTMKAYLSYWKMYPSNTEKMDCLYLKDWHFAKEFPNENSYRVPHYFASDWLNEYYDNNRHLNDDFRFVYIGPKDSWTPFHSDVLTSFSWSANICGRKKWILLPPGEEENFRDEFGHFRYEIDDNRPGLSEACEVIQEKGEVIFVPSGWYHQVRNLDDAVSINHNWINACNIFNVWGSLKSSLSEVKKEISDCEGAENWNEDCQKLLGATFGFDYRQFYRFLNATARIRMEKLKQKQYLTVYGNWSFGKNHMVFDLKRILSLLRVLVDDVDFQELDFTQADATKKETEEDDPVRFSQILDNFLSSGIQP